MNDETLMRLLQCSELFIFTTLRQADLVICNLSRIIDPRGEPQNLCGGNCPQYIEGIASLI